MYCFMKLNYIKYTLTVWVFLLQCLFAEISFSKNGMVVSASRLASEVGVDILKKGGNAFDAAVATGFALAVTYPRAGNIGGGGFLVAYTNDDKSFSLDFREKAPGLAHRDMYLDDSSHVVPGLSLYSHLAAGTPGTVDGFLNVWRDHGSGTFLCANCSFLPFSWQSGVFPSHMGLPKF